MKINKKRVLFFSCIVFLVCFTLVTSVGVEEKKWELVQGKNFVTFEAREPFYVETLVKLNPEIEVVSYIENGKSVGYINVFDGIGKNFIIQEGQYEIIVKKEITLIFPSDV